MKKKLSFKKASEYSYLTEVERLELGIVEGPYADIGYHGQRRIRAFAKRLKIDEEAIIADVDQRLAMQYILQDEHRYVYERREGYFNNIVSHEIDFDDRDFVCYAYFDKIRAAELLPDAIAEELERALQPKIVEKKATVKHAAKNETPSSLRRRAKRDLKFGRVSV